jgi:archaellum component FlaC
MSENNLLELIYKETLGIKEQQINTNRRLDKVDERLDKMDERLDKVDERLDGIDERLDKVDERLDKMDERLDGMDRRFDGVDERFEGMDKRFDGLTLLVTENSRRLKNIELTLENEITPNIMRVAEAHLDLSRKLDEALKIDREKEMMVLKINILDGEVRRLKERVDCLA